MENLNDVSMSLYVLARWGALMEGVNLVADACEEKGVDFETVNLEPLALRKYVEGTCDSIYRRMKNEEAVEKGSDSKDLLLSSLTQLLELEQPEQGKKTQCTT